jgi:hypothetical protein
MRKLICKFTPYIYCCNILDSQALDHLPLRVQPEHWKSEEDKAYKKRGGKSLNMENVSIQGG